MQVGTWIFWGVKDYFFPRPESRIASEAKKHHHWSQPVLKLGAIIGAVMTVACAILGNYPIAICGGMVFITNVIGHHYVNKFKPIQEVGKIADVMGGHLKNLESAEEKLGEHKEGLVDLKVQMEEIHLKVKKGLKSGAEGCQISVTHLKEVRQQLKDELEEGFKKIEDANKDLEKLEKKIESLQVKSEEAKEELVKVSDEMDRSFQSVSKVTADLQAVVKDLSEREVRFQQLFERYKKVNSSLNQNSKELLKNSKKMLEEARCSAESLEEENRKTEQLIQRVARASSSLKLFTSLVSAARIYHRSQRRGVI